MAIILFVHGVLRIFCCGWVLITRLLLLCILYLNFLQLLYRKWCVLPCTSRKELFQETCIFVPWRLGSRISHTVWKESEYSNKALQFHWIR